MLPAPSADRISYGPRRVPADKGMDATLILAVELAWPKRNGSPLNKVVQPLAELPPDQRTPERQKRLWMSACCHNGRAGGETGSATQTSAPDPAPPAQAAAVRRTTPRDELENPPRFASPANVPPRRSRDLRAHRPANTAVGRVRLAGVDRIDQTRASCESFR